MWKSSQEIDAIIDQRMDSGDLELFFALSLFWQRSVFPSGYRADQSWRDLVIPTPEGREYLDKLAFIQDHTPPPDFFLALFGTYTHHDLIFDWRKSDVEGILSLLNAEIIEKRIRLPHRFSRQLYDRFNDTYDGTRTTHLAAHDVATLLEDTPQGVYQISFLISGPLGIIRSEEGRFLPPSARIALWHCSDTGCGAAHMVSLLPPDIPVVAAFSAINKALIDHYGPPSEWAQCLPWTHRGAGRRSEGRRYVNLPILIAEAVIGEERIALVEAALQSAARDSLVKALTGLPRWAGKELKSPSEITSSLDSEEQLQLLLVLPDSTLVSLMDDLAQNKRISIAPGEIRIAKAIPPKKPSDALAQLGPLGVRSCKENPVVALTSVISRAYRSEGLDTDLAWRVGNHSNASLEQSLSSNIRDLGPEDSVTKLILVSHAITSFVATELGITVQATEFAHLSTSDRILWKLGFNRPQFDDMLSRFTTRLNQTNELVLTSTPIISEEEREQIRGSGVNLFISVESFLDRLLTFNVWLLSSDHYLETNFRYDASRAREVVPSILGAKLLSGNTTVFWNTNGENNIGVLLRYLGESVTWMDGRLSEDRTALLRPSHDLPHFADDVHRPFPFKHLALWADCDPNELRRYSEGYRSIVKLLDQANLGFIRNGFDHVREDSRFPGSDNMLACFARLREALELADVGRYIPKAYWMQKRISDRNRSFDYELSDYKGRTLRLCRPAMVSGLPALTFERPILIPAGNLLGTPNSEIPITLGESNAYNKYWEGYPRRSSIALDPGSGTHETSEVVISSDD